MGWTISTIILIILVTIMGIAMRNLLLKNERLEDFISKQSEAINVCNQRLKEIDNRGIFKSDDEIGWFWEELKKIQDALNEFTIK